METITITKEQFKDAVMKAKDKFNAIGNNKNTDSEHDFANFMMDMRNLLFGSLLAKVLFDGE